MAMVKLGNATVEVADNATALAIQSHVDALNGQVAAAQTVTVRADTAEGALAASRAEVEKLRADHATEIATVKADAEKTARARVALETRAQAICGADWKADGKTDREVYADALKALKVEFAADASDDYMRGALDLAAKTVAKPRTTADAFAANMNRGDAGDNGNGPQRLTRGNINWD